MSALVSGLDEYQSEAVAVRLNAVVSAGAGSGKTTVLARRYLSLVVDDGLDPESILVLTFTRKAQGEMYERIYRSLRAEPRAAKALESFSRSRISTIDSFCAEIARHGAPAFGIPPDFRIDDDARRESAERVALSFALSRRKDAALADLIAGEDFTSVWRGFLAEFAAKRLSLVAAPNLEDGFRAQLAAARADAILWLENLEQSIEAAIATPGCPAKVADMAAEMARAAAEAASSGPDDVPSCVAACRRCADLVNLRVGGNSDDAKLSRDYLRQVRDEIVPKILSCLVFLRDEPRSRAVLSLLSDFSAVYLAEARSAGALTFAETARLAAETLRTDPLARRRFRSRFRAIMVDEFQDDDPLQKDLLYLVAGAPDDPSPEAPPRPDVLFFVGDAKQSIYRFRGADVSVFTRLRDDLASGGGRCVDLLANYRSESCMVQLFNSLFSASFGKGPAGAADPEYAPQEPRVTTPGAVSGAVALELVPPEEVEGFRPAAESEAFRIARWILERKGDPGFLVAKRGSDGKKAAVRPDWDDFAVLLRATTRQGEIEAAFRRLGIPFHALNVCALYSEAPVNDMASALMLCVYPDDVAAYAAYLRSPFVGLSDDAFLLAVGAASDASLAWAEFPGMDGADEAKFREGKARLERVADTAAREGIAAAVSRLWYEEGYRLAVLESPGAETLLPLYDYFFATAIEADRKGWPLIAFADSLRDLQGASEKLDVPEPPEDRPVGVRIMTVHKSKGLEFPVVVIPYMGSRSRPESNSGIFHWSRDFGPVFNLSRDAKGKRSNPFWDRELERERDLSEAELKRLFYVACTRAETFLAFSWTAGAGEDEDGGDGDDGKRRKMPTFRDFVERAGGAEALGIPVVRLPFVSHDEWFSREGSPRTIDIDGFYSKTSFLPAPHRAEFTVTEINEAHAAAMGLLGVGEKPSGEDGIAGGITGLSAADFGTLAHGLIESELKGIPFRPEEFPGNPGPEAVALAKEMTANFFGSEIGKAARRAGSAVESEVPFLLRTGPYLVRGKMDLVMPDGDGWLVLDFKTGIGDPGAAYDAQLEAYRRAAEALRGGPVRAGLFLLRTGRFVERPASVDLEAVCSRLSSTEPEDGPSE